MLLIGSSPLCVIRGPEPTSRLFIVYRIWYTLSCKRRRIPRGAAMSSCRGQAGSGNFLSNGGRRRARTSMVKELSEEDRKSIGEDIKTVEFGWPIGMPVCRSLGEGLYEVRTSLVQNRIARVLFYIDKRNRMVLLHGFIKKTTKTP